MKVNLEAATWRVEAQSNGVTAEDMKGILRMARKMERALSSGPMAISTSEAGEVTNSMGSEFTLMSRTSLRDRENGSMERDING